LVRPIHSLTRALALWATICSATASAALHAQTPPRDSASRARDSTRLAGNIAIPGFDLPVQFNLRIESRTERDRNLRCNSVELAQINAQISSQSGCNAKFLLPPNFDFKGTLKSAGTVGDRFHVNVDYDMQREFESSNTVSLYYEGKPGAHLQRLDVGNINFTPPSSRFLTSSLPSGNYGLETQWKFGALSLKAIAARQTGNVVQSREFLLGGRTEQKTERDIEDYQIEPRRFFFTVDPTLLGRAYPNIDILNRAQLDAARATLPDTLRPTRVLVYRLQFGTQPQNPNGPQFRLQNEPGGGRQTYDLLREGVDYYMDRSLLWFALVRELNEDNERLVVAYNVRINGRDTVWTTTGGTPDLQLVSGREQVANLIHDPSVGPSSPAFRNEIRSVYRLAGEDLIRSSAQVRVVAGSGSLEHPLAGADATFLQMFGLAQSTNPAEFDYENRIWPRRSDGVFNLGAGAPDVRNGQSLDIAHIVRDYFVVFPSLQPFAAAARGLVKPGNPTNEDIYTIPGEYLNSPQRPTTVYRLRLKYQSAGSDETGTISLGASQMRQGSERVLLEGRPLVRDLDYRIDYDLGRVELLRPDTLLRTQRRISVRYEDNPGFAATPTTLAGFVTELPVSHGVLVFSAINQSQSTPFTRPQLGFQGSSTLTAGLTGQFRWDLPGLTSLVSRLPFGDAKTMSHVSLDGELASIHPQFLARNSGAAYIESFEGSSGISIALGDIAWAYSSMPAYGHTLRSEFGSSFFEPARAATLAFQTNVRTLGGNRPVVTRASIDPLAAFAGTGVQFNEPLLWLTLLPLDQRGFYNPATKQYNWTTPNQPTGRRWRSIRTVLRPSGIDVTGDEQLEFWTLADTSTAARKKNPAMIFDFGDVSENSLSFSPDTLLISRGTATAPPDSLFRGKHLAGFDTLDTERDRFSHIFNAEVNDRGLPGDRVDTLTVIDAAGVRRETDVPICRGAIGSLDLVGDPRTNCTVANGRLDEEDIDLDNALNFRNAQRENERLLRYVVDLSDPAKYRRVGGTFTDTLLVRGAPQVRTRRWVLVSIPFKAPTDSLNDVNRRRIRALRLTLVSGADQDDEEATQLPIAELRITGAPWLVRNSMTLSGIAGVRADGGFVLASSIGTNDSSATVVYQPPPGVTDAPDLRGGQFGSLTQVNEHSMRVQAGNMALYHRAETYFRFPSGPQNYLGFKQLRVWGRGHGDGWGTNGDLQMFVKVGRDENNFYLYRTSVAAGQTAAAWTDLGIDFDRFVNLRRKIQNDYVAGKKESIACAGVDSAIIAASPLPLGQVARRFAACDNGYMVYTIDPAVTAPNLAAVQELAVGIVRVGVGASSGGSGIVASDTLELWVDDIRLDHQVNDMGTAGQVSFSANAGGLADFRLNMGNRDPNFRQLGEQPTFLSERNIDMASTVRLDRLLPQRLGVSLPLTITKISLANDPFYLSQTDIPGQGIAGLRKPRTDLTTYSLSVRRTTPVTGGVLGPLLNNLSATSSYVSGVDRTEYQDGNAHNFTVALDYLVTDDSARTLHLPTWFDGVLGALPSVLQAGPVGTLRGSAFRWNPTQLRVTSDVVRGSDRRLSYVQAGTGLSDQPALSTALSRLWRNGSVLELRPTNGLNARWEMQSVRDLRDYGDTSTTALVTTRQRRDVFGANAGFERDRTMLTSATFAPAFSAWFRPRGEFGTQYSMLRDPNVRSLVALPGVIGVDSVLAQRDSVATAASFTLPRRMTAAQTFSAGTTVDVARALTLYSGDSSIARRIGGLFAPLDVSYTRSLLSALDAAPVGAPLLYQLGLGGQSTFRSVNGVSANTAGETGTLSASGVILLPLGTSFVNRFRRVNTLNWIGRPDASRTQAQAQVNGAQTQFPDVALRWAYRPTVAAGPVTNLDASIGYVRTDVTVSLPSLYTQDAPEIRHTHVETFPIGGTVSWAGTGGFSTGARYSLRRSIDSLPGSVAKSRGDEFSADAGRAFRVPASWGLGLRNDVRTRAGVQLTHNLTNILNADDAFASRLQDNGRQSYNLTADTNLNENMTFTFQGSHVVTFDKNLNRRFAQTVFSTVLQLQIFGGPKP
jgi:cell surface protein SprA